MKNEKFIKKWEKNRLKGKKKYVIMSGLKMAVVSICVAIIKSIIYDNTFITFGNFFVYFGGGVIGALIGTYIRWDIEEEKYNKLANDILE